MIERGIKFGILVVLVKRFIIELFRLNYYSFYNYKYKIYNLGNFKLKSYILLIVEDDKIFIK